MLAGAGYEAVTVQEAGWSGKTNGELLALAEISLEVLVTLDRKLKYQQNLAGRKIALLVIRAHSNRVADLQPHFAACIEALHKIQPGTVVEVGIA